MQGQSPMKQINDYYFENYWIIQEFQINTSYRFVLNELSWFIFYEQ